MTASFGPVSAALLAELHECVVRNGLVLWLDADDHYTDFVDQLLRLQADGQLNYEVRFPRQPTCG